MTNQAMLKHLLEVQEEMDSGSTESGLDLLTVLIDELEQEISHGS